MLTTYAAINRLHLRSTELHLRLSVFFDSSESIDYTLNVHTLYKAALSFFEAAQSLEFEQGGVLSYCSNYILQMVIASAFVFLRLLNSFFAQFINFEEGKSTFNKAVQAIRRISVVKNDLPGRLAEVLAQMWRGAHLGGSPKPPLQTSNLGKELQLKVRCRMSMSLVFDSVWRWREEYQNKERGNLDGKSLPFHTLSNLSTTNNSYSKLLCAICVCFTHTAMKAGSIALPCTCFS
jgi:hypothetical protein